MQKVKKYDKAAFGVLGVKQDITPNPSFRSVSSNPSFLTGSKLYSFFLKRSFCHSILLAFSKEKITERRSCLFGVLEILGFLCFPELKSPCKTSSYPACFMEFDSLFCVVTQCSCLQV